MRSFVALLAALSLCQARPQTFIGGAGPSFFMNGDQYIVSGTDASPGEFPWQLSQTRGGSHSCGASLLNANEALSAGHCVDGALPGSITIIAGLHQRSGTAGSQEVDVTGFTIHADYDSVALVSFSNDISIIHLASAITIGGNVQAALLPADNSNDYAGLTCVISGWGRTGSSNILPDTLQKASIQVIGTDECNTRLAGCIGCNAWENHICLFDTANNIGSCNGDSGGPLNCPDGGTRVAGVTSWGVSSGGDCLQTYPSVYTRTSAYLAWIADNSYSNRDDVDTICITIEDYCGDFVHLKDHYYDGILAMIESRVAREYYKALFARKNVFKSYDERCKVSDNITCEGDKLRLLFKKLVQKKQDISPLDAMPLLAEIIKLRDTSMMSLEITGFVTNYPDVKIDQLVSLLTMRGDVSRSDARQLVVDCLGEDHDVKARGGKKSIFSQL